MHLVNSLVLIIVTVAKLSKNEHLRVCIKKKSKRFLLENGKVGVLRFYLQQPVSTADERGRTNRNFDKLFITLSSLARRGSMATCYFARYISNVT